MAMLSRLPALVFAVVGASALATDAEKSCTSWPCREEADAEADAMRASLLQQHLRAPQEQNPPAEDDISETHDTTSDDDEAAQDMEDEGTLDISDLQPASPGNSEEDDETAKDFYSKHGGKKNFNEPVWHKLKNGHAIPYNEGRVIPGGSLHRMNEKSCQEACDKRDECKSVVMCGGDCWLKDREYKENEGTKHNNYCNAYVYSVIGYSPRNPELLKPSDAPVHTFYVYRSQAPATPDQDYPLANVNVASLGGAMWYLHNEVAKDCRYGNKLGARRFSITRIRRFKVTMKTTTPLYRKGIQYSSLCSFDVGECTGPHRGTEWAGPHSGGQHMGEWDEFGYTIGCGKLGEWPHQEFTSGLRYPDAIWYSLPGSCPTNDYRASSPYCMAVQPGGLCDSPTGQGNCTYSYEDAGEIDIDALVGITPKYRSRADFCRAGCKEATPEEPFCFGEDDGYDPNGKCGSNTFWTNIFDPLRNAARVEAARAAFNKKYPDMLDLPTPKCDFDRNKYR